MVFSDSLYVLGFALGSWNKVVSKKSHDIMLTLREALV